MISIVCIVPEEYKLEKWPKTFVELPKPGDLVESAAGKILQVRNIIHGSTGASSPHIKIELTTLTWAPGE